jgi:hypothetical protein
MQLTGASPLKETSDCAHSAPSLQLKRGSLGSDAGVMVAAQGALSRALGIKEGQLGLLNNEQETAVLAACDEEVRTLKIRIPRAAKARKVALPIRTSSRS